MGNIYPLSSIQEPVELTHHSVQISIRYADNIVTLYRLRRPSGRPADYT